MEKEDLHIIKLEVINSPTILTKTIQVVTRRRVPIIEFNASINHVADADGLITINVITTKGNLVLLKNQLEKLVDVINIKS